MKPPIGQRVKHSLDGASAVVVEWDICNYSGEYWDDWKGVVESHDETVVVLFDDDDKATLQRVAFLRW